MSELTSDFMADSRSVNHLQNCTTGSGQTKNMISSVKFSTYINTIAYWKDGGKKAIQFPTTAGSGVLQTETESKQQTRDSLDLY